MNTITRTLAALTLLVGCYNPNVPSGLYTCANPGDRCPDGLACVAGTCRYPTQDPQPMPFPSDRDCLFIDPAGTRWLGYLRGWNDREPYYAGTAKPWWNGQPSSGTTHRFVSMCGSGADSAWPEQAGYTRVIRCNSGLAGEPSSPVRCPRGSTPSDADWDMVTAEASVGVMCVQR